MELAKGAAKNLTIIWLGSAFGDLPKNFLGFSTNPSLYLLFLCIWQSNLKQTYNNPELFMTKWMRG
jgi:hypothetical protein